VPRHTADLQRNISLNGSQAYRPFGDLPARLANREPGLRNSLFCNAYSNIRWGFEAAALAIKHQRFWCPGGTRTSIWPTTEKLRGACFKLFSS
jgi:hypothetical protein